MCYFINKVFRNGQKSKYLCLIEEWKFGIGQDILNTLKTGM